MEYRIEHDMMKIAKLAHRKNISLKDSCVEPELLTPEKFEEVFHPEKMV